jgi:RNA polymerase sigma factor (sigma-70 family)
MPADDPEDAVLLRRYVETSSEEAFGQLVQRHVRLVYSAAVRQLGGNAHLAEDVTQGVFTELARQAVPLARHPALAGWLYTTTRHLVCRVIRSEHRRAQREREAHAMQELSPGDSVDWQALRPVLDDAMRDLRDADRLAVLLRHFEGRDLRSVGAALGVSQDAARMRVDRALDRLRAALARRGITATATALSSALGAHAMEVIPAGLASQVAATALSGAGAASAANGVLAMLSHLQTHLVVMKTSYIAASITAALAAVPLVVQHQRLEARQAEVSALRQQAAALDDLRADNERLRALAAVAQEAEDLRQGEAELARLREESARLRAATASPLHGALAEAQAAQNAAEAQRAEVVEKIEFQRRHELMVNGLKNVGLAARIYASDHEDRLPSSFEQIKELVNLPEQAPLEDFEFYPQARPISEREPELFIFREKQPRRNPEGRWVRAYALVDGSVQTLSSDSEDFTLAEQQRGGIASPDIPEHLRDDPAFQESKP